jgi:zinc transport system ATP-binding protein
LNKEKKVTILLISHDVGYVGQFATKLLYLDKNIIFYGPFKNFCESKEVESYFGEHLQHFICHQHENKNHKD